MIKSSYLFLLIAIVGVTSCNEDELELIDQSSTEVVAIANRNIMLTGNEINDSDIKPEVVKWWRSNFSNVDYACEGKEDEKLIMGNTYYTYKPDGSIYVREGISGPGNYFGTWEWTDNTKTAIYHNDKNFPYILCALNEDQLYFKVDLELEDCPTIYTQEFSHPVVE